MEDVYRSDQLENAIDFLEQAAIYHKDYEFTHRFKWVCISLHGALYGFAVNSVSGTNPLETIFKNTNKETNKWYLLELMNILKLCKNPDLIQVVNGKALELTEHQEKAIVTLNEYRNNFSHFGANGYSVIGSLDYVVSPVLEVIRFLGIESNNILYLPNQKQRVEQALSSLELSVKNENPVETEN
ncbi:hypothetical protein [Cytobacillus horneckiae]|uniref:hypothetical protein n=1 Tax=Cytobacillus horneckiae TaxID=549687 RepID=UPI00204019D9|nr:hypothetical protein [Cytobacillus horneckiae]MCM3179736.1 hypothetical protein [Cytobacillus horneckiae]